MNYADLVRRMAGGECVVVPVQQRIAASAVAPPVRVRKVADGEIRISGYAAVFHCSGDKGTQYQLDANLVERIAPTAFDRSLREKRDVLGLVNHDVNRMLGRRSAGSLKLSTDETGLKYSINAGRSSIAEDVALWIGRREMTGSSFSFIPTDVRIESADGFDVLVVEDLDLFDISVVTQPAYQSTTVGLRADCSTAIAARRAEVNRLLATDNRDLRKRELVELKAENDCAIATLERKQQRPTRVAAKQCGPALLPYLISGVAQRFGGSLRKTDKGWLGYTVRSFDDSLAAGENIECRLDHDARLIVACSRDKNVSVWRDDRGLCFKLRPYNTPSGREAVRRIQAGNIGVSIGCRDRRWRQENWPGISEPVRSIYHATLVELSLTSVPAFEDTSVNMIYSPQ